MSTFFSRLRDIGEEELKNAFAELLGTPIAGFDALNSGRNSRVYRIRDVKDDLYAGKVYYSHTHDIRDRLATEYLAISFLRENGIDAVPRPVAADRKKGIALFEYIEGEKIPPYGVSRGDLLNAVLFLIRLKNSRTAPGASSLLPASEACFSICSLFKNLDWRLSRLRAVESNGTTYCAMKEFLENDLIPALVNIERWARLRVSSRGLSCEVDLPLEERTLSPSDFGFHNALRTESGRLVWFDFEYFGWDDPTKMTADFLLHPAMELSRKSGTEFLAGILTGFHEIRDFRWRLETLYPLYGLKWCFILLNEFVPSDFERRDFSFASGMVKDDIQMRQLDKAKAMLERILLEYEDFPYC